MLSLKKYQCRICGNSFWIKDDEASFYPSHCAFCGKLNEKLKHGRHLLLAANDATQFKEIEAGKRGTHDGS